MLRHLAEGHQLTLVSFVRSDDTPEAIEHLRSICRAVHVVPIRRSFARNVRAGLKGLLSGLPIVIVRDETAEMTAILHRLAQETSYDVIHAQNPTGYASSSWRVKPVPLPATKPLCAGPTMRC